MQKRRGEKKNLISNKRVSSNKINVEYLGTFKEIALLFKLIMLKKFKKLNKNPKRILIINSITIGDFMVSLHALKYFIDKNNAKVDLMVSPPVKPLAKRIVGVRTVFTAKSLCNRKTEQVRTSQKKFPSYDFVLVMRISEDAYNILKKIKFKSIKSYLGPYIRYGLHLAGNLSNKDTVKQIRELNFEIIGEKEISKLDFDKIFKFSKSDYKKIEKLKLFKKKNKKIVIHTGSGWPVKLWDNNKWVKLLNKINELDNFQFIFVGANGEEKKHYNHIRKKVDFKLYSLIQKLDLKDLTLFMKNCDYFIGIDSGPRHIAHLIDLPSINLLGPGAKIFKPTNKGDIVIDKSNCKCVSLFCYHTKTCMEKITVNDVFKAFKKRYYIKRENKKK